MSYLIEPYVISKSSEDIGLPIATGEDDALSERYASQISSNEVTFDIIIDYRESKNVAK